MVHRDLKPDNIMYSSGTTEVDFNKIQVKIIDFGFAKLSEGKTLDEFLGTPYFLAPEIIKKEKYGTKCDIWSLGVVIFLLLTGEMPFEGKTTEELFSKIENGTFIHDERWGVISAEGKDFVTKCLTVDQDKRPSPADLIEHDWIKQVKINKLSN